MVNRVHPDVLDFLPPTCSSSQQDIDALITQLAEAAQSTSDASHAASKRSTAGMRDLVAAAQQYAAASVTKPDDFDLLYNHALVLQELASRCGGLACERGCLY